MKIINGYFKILHCCCVGNIKYLLNTNYISTNKLFLEKKHETQKRNINYLFDYLLV